MPNVKWTPDKIEFVLENYSWKNLKNVTKRFREKFKIYVTPNGIYKAYIKFRYSQSHGSGKVKV